MKTGIHPDYHIIKVKMTNGKEFTTRSTYGKAGDSLVLEIDPDTHPAWTGGRQRLLEVGQLSKFRKRFKGFSTNT